MPLASTVLSESLDGTVLFRKIAMNEHQAASIIRERNTMLLYVSNKVAHVTMVADSLAIVDRMVAFKDLSFCC